MKRNTWLSSLGIVGCCTLVLSGCTPGIQKQSIASSTATTVVNTNASWSPVEAALTKSEAATVYRIKSGVSIQNGSARTSYTVYGTVQLPDLASIQVHENSFNVAFYQQGQVAYTQDQNTWTKATPIANYNAFNGYQNVIDAALKHHVNIQQMNQTYVVDEYCNVYRFTEPDASSLPSFLEQVAGATPSTASSPIQYTVYVGQTSGFIRQVETQSVNTVNEVGPVETDTTTTFFDINKPDVAQIQIPTSLLSQLASAGQ